MRRHIPLLFAAALSFATVGSLAAQSIPAPTRRDSAGVRIVEHQTIKTSAVALRIDPKPTLDLGGIKSNPDAELNDAPANVMPRLLSDGRIVVHKNSNLLMFDRSGKLLQIIGRPGQGPGEFNEIVAPCIARGDTIRVLADRRVTVFDAAGKFVATTRTEGRPDFLDWGCFSDGSILVEQTATPEASAAVKRVAPDDYVLTLKHVRGDGTLIRELGSIPLQKGFAISAHYNVVVHADSIYMGDGRTTQFAVADANGKIVRIVRWHDPLARVTASTPLNTISGFNSSGTGADAARSGLPPFIPAYIWIRVDPAGRVWVWDHELGEKPRGFTLFSPAGDLLGRVYVPEIAPNARNVMIAGFRDNEVAFRWRDPDGAVHITFHAMR